MVVLHFQFLCNILAIFPMSRYYNYLSFDLSVFLVKVLMPVLEMLEPVSEVKVSMGWKGEP